MKIAVGSDHAGIEVKEAIRDHLDKSGHEVTDLGAFDHNSVDYPDFAKSVGQAVSKGEYDRGIVICGSGVGISIAANKIEGVRCALCHNALVAKLSREHNDANMLALGAWLTPVQHAIEIVDKWVETEFQGGRHQKRIDKITELEKERCLKI